MVYLKIILVALFLSGCSGFLAEAKGRGQDAADRAADAFVTDDCAMTFGAWLRRPANERLGIRLICDPAALEEIFGQITRP